MFAERHVRPLTLCCSNAQCLFHVQGYGCNLSVWYLGPNNPVPTDPFDHSSHHSQILCSGQAGVLLVPYASRVRSCHRDVSNAHPLSPPPTSGSWGPNSPLCSALHPSPQESLRTLDTCAESLTWLPSYVAPIPFPRAHALISCLHSDPREAALHTECPLPTVPDTARRLWMPRGGRRLRLRAGGLTCSSGTASRWSTRPWTRGWPNQSR